MKDESFRRAVLGDFREAWRQGADGQIADGQLAMSSQGWGFDLASVAVPVFLWQGTADRLVTPKMAEYLTQHLPQSKCFQVPDAGHFLTEHPDVIQQMRAILQNESGIPKVV